MRPVRSTLALIAMSVLLPACSIGIRHGYVTYQEVGQPLPIEVQLVNAGDDTIEGSVHFRSNAHPSFEPVPLQRRGNRLWAVLPTDGLLPHDSLSYYIDVWSPEKMLSLGSPARPYTVTILDRVGITLSRLRTSVEARDTAHPVRIILQTARQNIQQPFVEYSVPGMPGEVRAAMVPDGYGNFMIEIPPYAVQPGTWRYAVVVPIEGVEYRLPEYGYGSFTVATPRLEHALTEGASETEQN